MTLTFGTGNRMWDEDTGECWAWAAGRGWQRSPKEDQLRIRLKLTEAQARAVLQSVRITMRFHNTDMIAQTEVERKLLEKLPLKLLTAKGETSCATVSAKHLSRMRPAAAASSPAPPAAPAQQASVSTPTVLPTEPVQTSLPVM